MKTLTINRAPVLTLWGTIVARRLGFGPEESLALGKAVAALNAQAKGRSLGIFRARTHRDLEKVREAAAKAEVGVAFMGRSIPMRHTEAGLMPVLGGRLVEPSSVERYLQEKFADALESVRDAMETLARAYPPGELADEAFALYERFRPEIPAGVRGWGARGILDLERIRRLTPGR